MSDLPGLPLPKDRGNGSTVPYESPVGLLLLSADREALCTVTFATDGAHRLPSLQSGGPTAILREALRQLRAYFRRDLRAFDLPLRLTGTPFQLEVWNALRLVPYATTVSYGELARRIGRPSAVRAVGAANGANPLPIIVPCHRVIGARGSLTGYGGGLPVKARLLALERGDLLL